MPETTTPQAGAPQGQSKADPASFEAITSQDQLDALLRDRLGRERAKYGGIQRELPVEIIRYGDPDGQGDLKRKNQIALRLEIVYGWYVFVDKFALVKAA